MVMDIKILSAVLITLLAVGAGMGPAQASFSLNSLTDLPTKLLSGNETPEIPSFFTRHNTPNTSITAQIDFSHPNSTITIPEQTFDSASVRGSALAVNMEGFQTTAKTVNLTTIDGKITMHDNVTVNGIANNILLDTKQFNTEQGRISIKSSKPQHISITNASNVKINLQKAKGTLSVPNKDISMTESKVTLTKYTGSLHRNWDTNRLHLKGRIATATVGNGASKTTVGN